VRDPVRGELVCTVRFIEGSSELDAEGEATLSKVLDMLRGVKYREVSIEGHADSEGERDKNYLLSQARADMALRRLLERGATKLTSLVAIGYADTRPLVRNSTDEGRARNRRVEIRFKEGP
jgi:outer membrane protein OmpA-like peptidoglycan-associated protein